MKFAVPENNEFGTADQRKLHNPEGAKNNGKWGCRREGLTTLSAAGQTPAGRTTTQGSWCWFKRVQAFDAAPADKWARRAR